MRLIYRIGTLLCLLPVVYANAQTVIPPYESGFDSSLYSLGDLDNQQSWNVDAGSANVIASPVYSGDQSAILEASNPIGQVGLQFDYATGIERSLIDIWVKPLATLQSNGEEFIDIEGSLVGFFEETSGTQGQVFGFDGNGTGGGTWSGTGSLLDIDANKVADDYMRLTFFQDYTAKTWDLYVNGLLAGSGYGFIDDNLPSPPTSLDFFLLGNTSQPVLFDQYKVYTGDGLTEADANSDNILDAWDFMPETKLSFSDDNASDYTGWALAARDDLLLVGAYGKENGGQTYVFEYDGTTWSEETIITPADLAGGDYFGTSLDIWGNYAIIGSRLEDAPGLVNTGSVYVFKRSAGVWTEMQKVTADVPVSNAYFGAAVAAHSDRFIVGAENTKVGTQTAQGAAYIFSRSGETWSMDASLTHAELDQYDYFGIGVDIYEDWAVVGAYKDQVSGTNNSGAVYIWEHDGTSWVFHSRIVHPGASKYDSLFGTSVSISNGVLAVGASQDDGAVNNGGAVHLFEYNSTTDAWDFDETVYASDAGYIDYAGSSVSLYGDTLLMGAKFYDTTGNDAGAVYVFRENPATSVWEEQTILIASDGAAADAYSLGMSLSEKFIAVGAYKHDESSGADAGAAYVYTMIMPANLDVIDTTPPSKPENLTLVTGTSNGITFSWDPSVDNVGVTEYEIFRNGTSRGTTNGTSFAETGLAENIFYDYTVKASDAAGNISDESDALSYIIDTLAPSIPQNLNLDAVSINSATISWDASTDNVATTSYKVFRDGVEVGTTSNTQFTEVGLTAGVDYDYTVSALDAAVNESLESAALVVNIDPQLDQDSDGDGIKDLDELTLGTDPNDWDSDDDGEGDGWEHATEWKLIPLDSAASDEFGWSAAINGERVVFGAPVAHHHVSFGQLYTFTFDGANWVEEAIITANDNDNGDQLGESVAIFNDWIFASALGDDTGGLTQTGAVYVFRQSGGIWTQHQKLTASDYSANATFGSAIAAYGNTLIVGAFEATTTAGTKSGSAYIFETDSTANWQEAIILTDPDVAEYNKFGHAVGINANFAAVGAYWNDYNSLTYSGAVFVYKRVGGVWTSFQKLTHPTAAAHDNFGHAISIDGDVMAIGAIGDDDATSSAGAVFIYRYNPTADSWDLEDTVYARDAQATDYFGFKVVLKGDTLAVHSNLDDDMGTSSGSVYVYRYNDQTGDWEHQMKLLDSNGSGDDRYGHGLAISEDFIVAGSYFDDEVGTNSGSAFIYKQPIPVTIEDTEPDGLPDSWEQQIVDFDTNDSIIDITEVLGSDDFDNDGLSNAEEYAGGSDPTDVNSAPPGTFYVDDDASGNGMGTYADPYIFISEGISAAQDGNYVIVMEGVYTDVDNRNLSFGGRDIRLKSLTGAKDTIIDLESDGRAFVFDSGETENALVSGFTIINGNHLSGTGSAFYISSASSPVIKNCIIESNYAADKGGAFFITGSGTNPFILDCTITANKSNDGSAIYCGQFAVPYVAFNYFTVNIANVNEDGGDGVIYADSSDPMIVNNSFISNESGADGSLYFTDYTAPIIANNIIAYNSAGIYNADQEDLIESNIIHGNKVADFLNMNDPFGDPEYENTADGAGLGESKHGDFDRYFTKGAVEKTVKRMATEILPQSLSERHLMTKSALDKTQGPKLVQVASSLVLNGIFVDGDVVGGNDDGSSWENAKSSIADAVADANSIANVNNGVEIYVKEVAGSYSIDSTLYLSPFVSLYGGCKADLAGQDISERDPAAYVTTLDGAALPVGSNTGMLVIEGTGNEANEIDGFTFRNAHIDADIEDGKSGAAIHINFASPRVSNCRFDNNINDGVCGAMFIGISSAEIVDCVFKDNFALSVGALGIVGGSQGVIVSGCQFIDNSTGSEGAFFYSGFAGSGYEAGGPITLHNCEFYGNYGSISGGAIYMVDSIATIRNCIIAGNTAEEDGGGIGLFVGLGGLSKVSIQNCTIVENIANDAGGGIYLGSDWGLELNITNTILRNNQSGTPSVPNQFGGYLWNLTVSYSNVEDWTGGGIDNIDVDPLFVDPDNNDYHLTLFSPCIDKASGSSGINEDIDDDPRPMGVASDIGADEFSAIYSDGDTDHLSDYEEVHVYFTDYQKRDTDGDFMPDGWEVSMGIDPNDSTGDNGAAGDIDNDGVDNLTESQQTGGSAYLSMGNVIDKMNLLAGDDYTISLKVSMDSALIESVKIFNNNSLLGEALDGGDGYWSYDWNNIPASTIGSHHNLQAVLTGTDGKIHETKQFLVDVATVEANVWIMSTIPFSQGGSSFNYSYRVGGEMITKNVDYGRKIPYDYNDNDGVLITDRFYYRGDNNPSFEVYPGNFISIDFPEGERNVAWIDGSVIPVGFANFPGGETLVFDFGGGSSGSIGSVGFSANSGVPINYTQFSDDGIEEYEVTGLATHNTEQEPPADEMINSSFGRPNIVVVMDDGDENSDYNKAVDYDYHDPQLFELKVYAPGSADHPGAVLHPEKRMEAYNLVVPVIDLGSASVLDPDVDGLVKLNIQSDYQGNEPIEKIRLGPIENPTDGILFRVFVENGSSITELTADSSGYVVGDLTNGSDPLSKAISQEGVNVYINGITPKLGTNFIVNFLNEGNNVKVVEDGDYSQIWRLDLLKVDLVPDYDRDGVIRENDETIDGVVHKSDYDRARNGDTFYFWINDDSDDTSSLDGVGENGDDIPGRLMAWGDSRTYYGSEHKGEINGLRDVIDFFPVNIDLHGLLDNFTDDDIDGNYVELALSGAPVNFIEYPDSQPLGLDKSSASFYRRNLTFANNLVDEGVTKDVVHHFLSPEFIKLVKQGRGVILLEGREVSDQPLILNLYIAGISYEVGKLQLKLSSVEKMFRHVSLYDVFDEEWTVPIEVGRETILWDNEPDGPPGYPDSETNGDNVVYIHGFNVDQQSSRGSQSNIFKRLYQTGSKAQFTGVSWHGKPVDFIMGNYHKAVINAFETSRHLNDRLSFMSGKVTVLAHSLANMLVSSAIEKYGFSPDNYFMIDAATPIEAYDGQQTHGSQGVEMKPNMTHPEWNGIYDEYLFASNWYLLFEDGSLDENGTSVNGDNRQVLTWKNYFDSISTHGGVYNFYSEGEEIVRDGNGQMPNVIFDTVWHKAEYTWVQQEMLKGLHGPIPPYNQLFPDQHGGWGFETSDFAIQLYPHSWAKPDASGEIYVRMSQSDIDGLGLSEIELNAKLRTLPFFEGFTGYMEGQGNRFPGYDGDLLLAPLGDASASLHADRDSIQHKLLAEAIPTLSFAVAANSVDNFGTIRNIHMVDYRSSQWPGSRLDSYFGNRWLHSDFKDISYVYIYQLFEKFVEIGGLDQ